MKEITVTIDKKKLIEALKQLFGEDEAVKIAKVFADYVEELETFKMPDVNEMITDPMRIIGMVKIDSKYFRYEGNWVKTLKVKFRNGDVIKYIKADEEDIRIIKDDITVVEVNKTHVNKEFFDRALKLLSTLHNFRYKRNDYSRFTIMYPKEPDNPLIVSYGDVAVFIAPMIADEKINRGGD